MILQILAEKDPAEILIVDFDFSQELGTGETLDSASVAVTVEAGYDLTPSHLLVGTLTLNDTNVLQSIGGGVAGTSYTIKCTAPTSGGKILVRKAILPVCF